jgi:hypothetical protein
VPDRERGAEAQAGCGLSPQPRRADPTTPPPDVGRARQPPSPRKLGPQNPPALAFGYARP